MVTGNTAPQRLSTVHWMYDLYKTAASIDRVTVMESYLLHTMVREFLPYLFKISTKMYLTFE